MRRACARLWPTLLALALAAHAAPPIRRRQAGGTTAFDVHAGTSYSVSVSPDGQWLAFDLQGSLWVVPAKGGEARRITDYFNDAHLPVWSPDGSRLAYYAYRDGDYDLWTVRPDGSDARQLTHGEDDDRDPAWSPDGKTVVFASDRDGSYDIWAVDVASGATRQITRGPARGPRPTWSADGQTSFSGTAGAQNGIFTVAASGGEAKLAPRAQRHPLRRPLLWPQGRAGLCLARRHRQPSGDRRQAGQREGECLSLPRRLAGGRRLLHLRRADPRRKGATVTTVPFSARLEATKPEYIRAKRDFTSTEPRRVLGIDPRSLQMARGSPLPRWAICGWCPRKAASPSN
jgi:WD40 repeat protein